VNPIKNVIEQRYGQNFSEYVLLIIAFTAALFAMQTYVRRGVQAKLRDIMVSSNFTGAPHPVEDQASGVNIYTNTVSNIEQTISTNFMWSNSTFRYIEESETVVNERQE